MLCVHVPPCPGATDSDHEAARVVATHPEQGWSLLCNGVVTFDDNGETVDARALLSRTVLYKVGHHGSHNATLAGKSTDSYANLAWMAQGPHAGEFTAMITAVNEWAMTNSPPWVHPLPSIKTALRRKAQGRVLQTDENKPRKPASVSAGEWKRFTDRLVTDDLFFDLTIEDEA